MYRIIALFVVLSLPAASQQPAPPPSDVAFTIDCNRSPCRFQLGEVIDLNLRFNAAVPGYTASTMDGRRDGGPQSFLVDPPDAATDPRDPSYMGPPLIILSGTPPALVPGRPLGVPVELNLWLRFARPGTFRIRACSSRVRKESTKTALYLISEPLTLEIVPADSQWQKEQLKRILAELPNPGDSYSLPAARALRALTYLRSEDALNEIRRRLPDKWPFPTDFYDQYRYYSDGWDLARIELLRSTPTRGRPN